MLIIQEGWPMLDCVYFAVMTLTTSGLGDYVPTTNSAKIVCSIFMYFGVACVGLLLGLLHANSLDHASKKTAGENLINSCAHCSREVESEQHVPQMSTNNPSHSFPVPQRSRRKPNRNILEEMSLLDRNQSSNLPIIDESQMQTGWFGDDNNRVMGDRDGHDSDTASNASTISMDEKFKPVTIIKAAKYIFLTLQQAFANTLFIIGTGSLGFMHFEKMTTVDAFYFTTSLLTTVGYGDIVPKTPSGKVFASCFTIVAWICLLYNISMISMIPLELRKRRIEHAVLIQVCDETNIFHLFSIPS